MASFSAGYVRRALEQYDEALRIAVQKSVEAASRRLICFTIVQPLCRALARYPEALEAYDVGARSCDAKPVTCDSATGAPCAVAPTPTH